MGIEGHVCITQTALDLLGATRVSCLCRAPVISYFRGSQRSSSLQPLLLVTYHIMQDISASHCSSQGSLGESKLTLFILFIRIAVKLTAMLPADRGYEVHAVVDGISSQRPSDRAVGLHVRLRPHF